jgi:hypothetical protein
MTIVMRLALRLRKRNPHAKGLAELARIVGHLIYGDRK